MSKNLKKLKKSKAQNLQKDSTLFIVRPKGKGEGYYVFESFPELADWVGKDDLFKNAVVQEVFFTPTAVLNIGGLTLEPIT